MSTSRAIPLTQLPLTRHKHSFTALDVHLKYIQDEISAQAAASMAKVEIKESKGSSSTEKANGKKRKTASVSVEKLKKANTRGMAKLSTFFKPKVA